MRGLFVSGARKTPMLDTSRDPHAIDLADLQAEMRHVRPQRGPRKSEQARKTRELNRQAFEKSMRLRQRPSRVS